MTNMHNDQFKIWEMKIHPNPFAAILIGVKTFEMRIEDPARSVKRGDVIRLREWEPSLKEYTGSHALVEVLDIARPSEFFGTDVIDNRYLVYSIRLLFPTAWQK